MEAKDFKEISDKEKETLLAQKCSAVQQFMFHKLVQIADEFGKDRNSVVRAITKSAVEVAKQYDFNSDTVIGKEEDE